MDHDDDVSKTRLVVGGLGGMAAFGFALTAVETFAPATMGTLRMLFSGASQLLMACSAAGGVAVAVLTRPNGPLRARLRTLLNRRHDR